MGPRRLGPRRHRGVPHRPWLGPGRPLPPRPRPPGHHLRPRSRIPAPRHGLRRGLLRHQPPRGPRHRPPAAHAPRSGLGTLRTRRHRPRHPQGHAHRRVRGCLQPGLHVRLRSAEGRRRVRHHRHPLQRHLRAYRLHLRPHGAGRHPRHRLLGLPRRDPPRLPGAPAGGVLARSRRGRHRAVHAHRVRRVRPPAGAGAGRAVQGVRRGRGRYGVLRRGRARPPRTPLRRAAQRASGSRGRTGVRRQPGRGEQRAHRAQ
ncbi:hypothetical protein Saa2_09296 [Streptomyces acidiscabies]|nr:hypothetical protein Saa2_09296 [Streptomyces acidiscabies]